MRPRRRQSHAQWRQSVYHAAQYCRLEAIARREIEPLFDREHYFRWTLDSEGRANLDDFILPPPLFLAEWKVAQSEGDIAATSSPKAV
ncbi:hypothetical protein BH09PSE1_BH09PSE1_16260 [soil metagenome]